MAKHIKKQNGVKRLIIILLLIIAITGIILLVKIKLSEYLDNRSQIETSQVLDEIDIPDENITEEQTERMLQVQELKKGNNDIVGWLEIADTNINYPVLQGSDNDYYLTHNYKNEEVAGGSIFLDKDYSFIRPSDNLLIYGHRNTKGLMFEDLEKYADESFYNNHKTIRFTTVADDSEYEVMAVFYSRVYYKNETDVFRYYYFINAENEEEYNEFVENAKESSIYDTSVTAEYGDQLLTLSTCDYNQENGRFAVVAKKIED